MMRQHEAHEVNVGWSVGCGFTVSQVLCPNVFDRQQDPTQRIAGSVAY